MNRYELSSYRPCGPGVEGHYKDQDNGLGDDERELTGRRRLVSNI